MMIGSLSLSILSKSVDRFSCPSQLVYRLGYMLVYPMISFLIFGSQIWELCISHRVILQVDGAHAGLAVGTWAMGIGHINRMR